MKKYFFTFGCSQPYRNHFVLIHAPNSDVARSMMFKAHGKYWSMEYDEQTWKKTSMSATYKMLAEFCCDDPYIDWSMR